MAAVDYLTSPSSPVLRSDEWNPPAMVYLTLYDRVFQSWSMEKATPVYIGAIASLATVLIFSSINFKVWRPLLAAFLGTPLGFVGGVAAANAVGYIMLSRGHGLSW